MLTISKYRQQEWHPESMTKYHKAFSDGSRDASIIISLPLISIFAAEGGVAMAELKGGLSTLTPALRATYSFVRQRIISGFNSKLAVSKFALSLTSQYVGAKAINQDFGISTID